MGTLLKSKAKKVQAVTKNNNGTTAIVENSTPRKHKHEFKVLTLKDVNENRSKAYNFLTF